MSVENEIIFKWTNLCRLCLSSESHIDLFSSEVLSQDCLSKIRSCLNLLVSRQIIRNEIYHFNIYDSNIFYLDYKTMHFKRHRNKK